MAKLLVVLLAVGAFAAAVLVPIGMSGHLNREGFEKILKKDTAPTPAAVKPDPANPLLRALQKQREALAKREAKLKEDEQRVRAMQADLDQLRDELEEVLSEIQAKLSEEDAAQQQRLAKVAEALADMKPRNAAETLETFTADEASRVLMLVKDRDRTKILDAMEQEQAALILKTLQTPRI